MSETTSASVEQPAQKPQQAPLAPGQTNKVGRYIAGYIAFWIFTATGVTMVANVLMPQFVKNIGASNPAAVIGVASSIAMIVAMVSNVVFGAISDRTRTRFGRRAPWLVIGGIVSIVSFALMPLQSSGAGVIAIYSLAQVGMNIMYAPFYAVLSDNVPESRRGTVSMANGLGNSIGCGIGPMLGSLFIGSVVPGLLIGAFLVGFGGVVAAFVFPNKNDVAVMNSASRPERTIPQQLLYTVTPPRHCPDFWKAFVGRTLIMLAVQMISSYLLYLVQDFLHLPNTQAAALIGTYSLIVTITSFVTLIVGPLSDKLGRRKLPTYIAVILICGSFASWILGGTGIMSATIAVIIAAVLYGAGYGTFTAIDQALNVDVLPSKEDAGKDLGFINVGTTAGMAAGALLTSSLYSLSGGYMIVFPVAIAMVIIGAFAISRIKVVK
ncbi:MAG: MFS transporter [Bifidobacteriaceae bacterium]|jgi:MFS family permease|nr:MFS transporter [Bifidobacteriaceae bacterium]